MTTEKTTAAENFATGIWNEIRILYHFPIGNRQEQREYRIYLKKNERTGGIHSWQKNRRPG